MYGHFIQFTIPKIGQALVAVVLYLNFLKLPFVACFAGVYPAVYLLLPQHQQRAWMTHTMQH